MFFPFRYFFISNFFLLILTKQKFFLEIFLVIFRTKYFNLGEGKKISSKLLNLFFSTQKNFVPTKANMVCEKILNKIKRSICHNNSLSNKKNKFKQIKNKILNSRIKNFFSQKYFLFFYLDKISPQNIIIKEILFGINEDMFENNFKFLENERRNYLGWNRPNVQFSNQFVSNLKKIYFLIKVSKISDFCFDKRPKKNGFNLFPVILPLNGLAKKERMVTIVKRLVLDKKYFGFINLIKEKIPKSIFENLYYREFSLISKKNFLLLFKNKLTLLNYLRREICTNNNYFKHFIKKKQKIKKNFLFFNFFHKSIFQLNIYLIKPILKRKKLFFLIKKLFFSRFIYKILNRGIIKLICFTILKIRKRIFFGKTLFCEFFKNFDRFQHKNFTIQINRNLFVDNCEKKLISYFLSSFFLSIKKVFFTIQKWKKLLKNPKNFYILCKKNTNKKLLALFGLIERFINFFFFKFYRSFYQISWINFSKLSRNYHTKFKFFIFVAYIVEKFIKRWKICTIMKFRGKLYSHHFGPKILIFLFLFKTSLKLQNSSHENLKSPKKKKFIWENLFHILSKNLNSYFSYPEIFDKIDSNIKSKSYFLDFFSCLSFVKIILVYKKIKKKNQPKKMNVIKSLFKFRNPWKETKK